ncbi:MAG: hypothetical protein KC635_21795 [Myxococcales bacterium]|nr:hypothetical protein [Myxococcales bacterium]MCB9735501.1 hypothetical protein [Deltaproteobacteria bacterium]
MDDALPGLLAVDLGLRAGLARFGADGALAWYRSTHFASRAVMKQALPGVLADAAPLGWIVVEGDRALGDLWERAAARIGAELLRVTPETWRASLLLPRERRSGALAKERALSLAREIIARSPAANPTSLRHDAAEAVLIGAWAVRELGLGAPRG